MKVNTYGVQLCGWSTVGQISGHSILVSCVMNEESKWSVIQPFVRHSLVPLNAHWHFHENFYFYIQWMNEMDGCCEFLKKWMLWFFSQKTIPVVERAGQVINANTTDLICYQVSHWFLDINPPKEALKQSEDCLFLSVYTPYKEVSS